MSTDPDGGAWRLNPRAVARSFGAASRHYDAAARLQAQVREELLSRVEAVKTPPADILDLGCGTGAAAVLLKRRFRSSRVVATDLAPEMIEVARARSRFWRPFRTLVADAHALPFEDAHFDLVFTNLMLQWADPLDAALGEIRRVLRPGGLLLASSFGPETLQELRRAWSAVDDGVHVNRFIDMHDFGSALGRAGFAEPVLDTDRHRRWYPDAKTLMRELKSMGAHNVNAGRARGLTGRAALSRMTEAYEGQRQERGLPGTWQVVYATAWAPDAVSLAPMRVGAETHIPLARLKSGLTRR